VIGENEKDVRALSPCAIIRLESNTTKRVHWLTERRRRSRRPVNQPGVSSRAPRFYALNACAIRQAHTRGNLTSTVCCFGKPCLNTRLQLLCVLVSSLEPHGVVPPSSGRTVLQVPMGQANCAKTRSQSVDRSSLHTFGAVWIKPLARLPELGLVSTGLIRRSSRRVCAAVTDRNSVLRARLSHCDAEICDLIIPYFQILMSKYQSAK